MENINEFKSGVNMIGQHLPDMSLEIFHNNEKKDIKLSDYEGDWLILFFYPADFTFVCPTELREMAQCYDKFKELKAEVLSVSCDSVFTHKAWHDSSEAIAEVKFPMAADPTAKLAKALGVYIEDKGEDLRGTFIVNPAGIIQSIEINSDGIGRSAKELIRKLQAAIFVHEHGDQVCPAGWQPGDETLKPGLDLVGKI